MDSLYQWILCRCSRIFERCQYAQRHGRRSGYGRWFEHGRRRCSLPQWLTHGSNLKTSCSNKINGIPKTSTRSGVHRIHYHILPYITGVWKRLHFSHQCFTISVWPKIIIYTYTNPNQYHYRSREPLSIAALRFDLFYNSIIKESVFAIRVWYDSGGSVLVLCHFVPLFVGFTNVHFVRSKFLSRAVFFSQLAKLLFRTCLYNIKKRCGEWEATVDVVQYFYSLSEMTNLEGWKSTSTVLVRVTGGIHLLLEWIAWLGELAKG